MLPLAGACSVTLDGERFDLEGRDDVFAAVSDFVYAPRDTRVAIASEAGGRFALATARADRRFEPRYVPAADVRAELHGGGSASRQINTYCAPDTLDADRLFVVEVLTPGGNWSSYPAAQARRGRARRRDRARGDLLLRGRARRLRLSARLLVRPRARDRHHGRGAHRRCDRHAARLPRAVDGRAGLRPLLPERDGGAGRARVALHRRPGARLAARRDGRIRRWIRDCR